MRPSPQATLALLATLTLVSMQPARASSGRPEYEKHLPPIARSKAALEARDKLLDKARVKRFAEMQRGEDPIKRARKEAEERKLTALAKRIGARIAASGDRKPIVIVVDGMDGVGKSSTIERLQQVFAGHRRVTTVHRGQPAADERTWLEWPLHQLGRKIDVLILDRSYYGGVVYDRLEKLIDKRALKTRIKQVRTLERTLVPDLHVVKIYLEASDQKLAETLAKREFEKPERLAENDYVHYGVRDVIRGHFEHAVKKTDRPSKGAGWHRIAMDNRFEGRKEVLKVLGEELR